MWSIECFPDPVTDGSQLPVRSAIVLGRAPIAALLPDASHRAAFQEGDREAHVALADFVARKIAHSTCTVGFTYSQEGFQVTVEPLDRHVSSRTRRGKRKARSASSLNNSYAPYMLERSDVWCDNTDLYVTVRVLANQRHGGDCMLDEKKSETSGIEHVIGSATEEFLTECFDPQLEDLPTQALQHVACAVVQFRMRSHLASIKAVAFVADGSILPRKSGASSLPMASPPAIPFEAPKGSITRQEIAVEMGLLRPFLPGSLTASTVGGSDTTVSLTGLVIPAGITLIVGGGYHGKVITNFTSVCSLPASSAFLTALHCCYL